MQKQLSKAIQGKLQSLLANTGDMALKRRARRIIEEIAPKDGDKILEVGCGDGYYLHLLSSLGLKLSLTGADIDKRALDSAKKNLKGKKVKLIHADLMKGLPFRAGSFDKIIMSEVAEHLPDDVKGVAEVRRVLKKGGRLVLTVPNWNFPIFWDPVNWILQRIGHPIRHGFWAGIWNQHLRLYKPNQISGVVKSAGFKVQKTESLTFWAVPFSHYFLNLAARMLHHGGFSPNLAKSVNKYKNVSHRPFYVSFAFWLFTKVDHLNDFYLPKSSGVGVLVVSMKK